MDLGDRKQYFIVPKDLQGNEFTSADGLRLGFEVAPAGVVKLTLDNRTLHVRAERSGKAVVRVFSEEDSRVQDFFEVFRIAIFGVE